MTASVGESELPPPGIGRAAALWGDSVPLGCDWGSETVTPTGQSVQYRWNYGKQSLGRDGALGRLTGYCPNSRKDAAATESALATEWEVRALLRRYSVDDRIAICGARVHADPEVVTREFANGDRRAHWTGVILCNRSGCPVCSAIRARKFGRVVCRTLGIGGHWQHLVLTVPHKAGEDWSTVYDRLIAGVHELTRGTCGKLVMHDLVQATIRATETTWSVRSGWHVHLHCLWQVRRPFLAAEREIVRDTWCSHTGAHSEHGVRFGAVFDCSSEWERAQAAKYVSKLASELSGACKHAHSEHWTMGEVFRRASEGERRFVELVQQYQLQTKGRRLYQLDRRARLMHDAAPERPEDAIVNEWRTSIHRAEFAGLSRTERRARDRLALYLPLEVAAMARGDPSEHVWETVDSLLRAHDVQWRSAG